MMLVEPIYLIIFMILLPFLLTFSVGVFCTLREFESLEKNGGITEDEVWKDILVSSPDEIQEYPFTQQELDNLRRNGL